MNPYIGEVRTPIRSAVCFNRSRGRDERASGLIVMHEILRDLPSSARVLDLGCDKRSFSAAATAARVIRLDREIAFRDPTELAVQGDAALLPFADGSFDAIVSNHSLEHFDDLDGALREIGRVVRRHGSLYVAVPDASTHCDKLYR